MIEFARNVHQPTNGRMEAYFHNTKNHNLCKIIYLSEN